MLNVRKNIRGSLLTLGLPCLTFALFHGCLVFTTFSHLYTHTTQHNTHHNTLRCTPFVLYRTCMQQLQLDLQPPPPASGIKPRPPAWESSTLPSEPLDVRKNTSMFSIYIVNIRVHFMLHFHLTSFIIKI